MGACPRRVFQGRDATPGSSNWMSPSEADNSFHHSGLRISSNQHCCKLPQCPAQAHTAQHLERLWLSHSWAQPKVLHRLTSGRDSSRSTASTEADCSPAGDRMAKAASHKTSTPVQLPALFLGPARPVEQGWRGWGWEHPLCGFPPDEERMTAWASCSDGRNVLSSSAMWWLPKCSPPDQQLPCGFATAKCTLHIWPECSAAAGAAPSSSQHIWVR